MKRDTPSTSLQFISERIIFAEGVAHVVAPLFVGLGDGRAAPFFRCRARCRPSCAGSPEMEGVGDTPAAQQVSHRGDAPETATSESALRNHRVFFFFLASFPAWRPL